MLGLIENGSTHAIVSYIWNNNSIFLEPTYHSKGSALLLFSLYTIVYINQYSSLQKSEIKLHVINTV